MNIEQLALHVHKKAAAGAAYQKIEALMVNAARDGQLTYADEEMIVATMTRSGRPTADICGLFRRLQERVWDGELRLDRPHR
ncbi:MAG: hypothetical protein F6K00_21760 [Leptolyngbya sp. SIOISBB]|nr:hypothetical protein [Leptolyngbya sp. SIOISBB]